MGRIRKRIGIRKLKGHEHLYRIRIGNYRIVYEIDDQAKITFKGFCKKMAEVRYTTLSEISHISSVNAIN